MSKDGYWANDAIVKATASAFDIEIRIVSATAEFIAVIFPDFGYMPTGTVFLCLIEDVHYVATANIVAYGGVTSGGVSLSKTLTVH